VKPFEHLKNKSGIIPLRRERLARKMLLASVLMSFIPLLLIFSAMQNFVFPNIPDHEANKLRNVFYLIVVFSTAGYILVHRIVRTVLAVIEQAKKASEGQLNQTIEAHDAAEIGELAKAFNRITKDLEHKIEELESSKELIRKLMQRIGTAFASFESVDAILELIVENMTAALEATSCNLLLIDGEKKELYVKAVAGQHRQSSPDLRIAVGEGIVGSVAQNGRAAVSSGVSDPLDSKESNSAKSLLCVPLLIHERTMGVLYVTREEQQHPFVRDDLLLLSNIGSQVAVAVENYRLNQDIESTYLETIMALAMAVEAKDPYSLGHSKRVGAYAIQIAEAMGVDDITKKVIKDGSVLHDVGKIGIKDNILLKPSPLDPEEIKIMQQHPTIGEAILKPVRSLAKVSDLVRYHHERYDGKGYPYGLKGEEIPLAARIVIVADSYDSMITDRPYRKRLSQEAAIAELRRGSGSQFDSHVVDAFLKALEQRATPLITPATQSLSVTNTRQSSDIKAHQ